MAITGYQKVLVDWNETGNNSKLKLSKANIRRETDLIEKCKARYEAAGVPLPSDFVTAVLSALRKIRNAATVKVQNDARNAIASAARSDLRKKANDPDQHLDEAEQVKYEKDRASSKKDTAKGTDLRKRDADPDQHLNEGDQARVKKLRVQDDKATAKVTDLRKRDADPDQHLNEGDQALVKKLRVRDDKATATKKADRDEKWKSTLLMLQKIRDTEHGLSLHLPIDAGAFIVTKLELSALQMTFGGEGNANKIMHRFHSLFHLSNTPPDGMQMVMVEEVLKKVLLPATMLEKATIQGRPLLPGGIPHLKHIVKKLSNNVWGHPGFFQCLAFYFRHHGRYYKHEQGTVVHAYCIFDTNDRFPLFKQHLYNGGVTPHHELLCRAEADQFIAPDACIEITIGCDFSFEDAAFRLIRNNGDMETPLDFPIPR